VCYFTALSVDRLLSNGKVKVEKVKLHNAMKTYGGVDVQIYVFLTSALVGVEWSASHPGRFTPIYPIQWVLEALQYPLNRRLGGPHIWPGRRGEEKNLVPTRT
jgi:hypothetical protein